MVVYPSLSFYEWISISTFILYLLLNMLLFVYEQIFFIYIVHIIFYGFMWVRPLMKAFSSSMLG